MFGSKSCKRKSAREISRNVDAHTIGTHVSARGAQEKSRGKAGHRKPPRTQKRANSAKAMRRSQQASACIAAHSAPIAPAASTGRHQHAPAGGASSTTGGTRAKKRAATLVEAVHRRQHRRNILVGLGITVAILAIAIGVGVYAYFSNTNSRLDLAPSNASEALIAAEADAPYYVLCSADLGTFASAPASHDTPENTTAYMLVRVDEQTPALTFITIPPNTLVADDYGNYVPLYTVLEEGGEAELVREVADFAGVDISHFVSTSATGLARMADLVGGVSVTLDTVLDDPYAGNITFAAGEQTLEGAAALAFLRSVNVPDGLEGVAQNRMKFTVSLLTEALSSSSGLDLANVVSNASDYIDTDLSAADLLSLATAMQPLTDATIYACVVPGVESTQDDAAVYKVSTSEWEAMMARIAEGLDPNGLDEAVLNVNPADVTVEVRNGTQTSGAAAQMASILEEAGFEIGSIGNTDDSTIYPETLIIYIDSEHENDARAVLAALGSGRLVYGGDFYSSRSDVIAIVGSDWSLS